MELLTVLPDLRFRSLWGFRTRKQTEDGIRVMIVSKSI